MKITIHCRCGDVLAKAISKLLLNFEAEVGGIRNCGVALQAEITLPDTDDVLVKLDSVLPGLRVPVVGGWTPLLACPPPPHLSVILPV